MMCEFQRLFTWGQNVLVLIMGLLNEFGPELKQFHWLKSSKITFTAVIIMSFI